MMMITTNMTMTTETSLSPSPVMALLAQMCHGLSSNLSSPVGQSATQLGCSAVWVKLLPLYRVIHKVSLQGMPLARA